MTIARFIDLPSPYDMPTAPMGASPRFFNRIQTSSSGDETVQRVWTRPLWKYTLPEAIREHSTLVAVRNHFLVMGGTAHTFPFRDLTDFASIDPVYAPDHEPIITGDDQIIGVGDGVTTDFQIVKNYEIGAHKFVRNIILPDPDSLIVFVDGEPHHHPGYDFTRPGGVISFRTAPTLAQVISCGYLFDVEVRYEADDAFEGIIQKYGVSGFSDLTLLEVPHTTEGEDEGGGRSHHREGT